MVRGIAAALDPPRFLARTPYGYFDVTTIRAALQSVGFDRIEIETVDKVTRAASAEQAATGFCEGTPLRAEIEARDPARLDEATTAATEALRARFGGSSFDNHMRALVVTAWR